MAKLGSKTFRRNSKRRISKKNTKKSKSRRRFRKFGGGYVDNTDPSLKMVVEKLQARMNNLNNLSKNDKDYVESWGKKLSLPFIQQNAGQQPVIDSYKKIVTEIINEMKGRGKDTDDIALVIYGDETSESIKKIENVILPQNIMSAM
jgi:hypothetical protein